MKTRKQKIKRFTLTWGVVILVLVASYYIGTRKSEIVYEKEIIDKQVILDNLIEKINELKGKLVNDIRQCESGGYEESDGLVTFDPHPTNKKVQALSFGLYQFKKSTVQHYYKTLMGKDITGLEAIQIALSEDKSAELASKIIFETTNGLSNWYNCTKKVNAKGQLETINMLLK